MIIQLTFFRHKICEFVIILLKSVISLSMYEAIFLYLYLQVFGLYVWFLLWLVGLGFFVLFRLDCFCCCCCLFFIFLTAAQYATEHKKLLHLFCFWLVKNVMSYFWLVSGSIISGITVKLDICKTVRILKG